MSTRDIRVTGLLLFTAALTGCSSLTTPQKWTASPQTGPDERMVVASSSAKTAAGPMADASSEPAPTSPLESEYAEGTQASIETPVTANVSRVTFAEEGADFDPSVSRDGSHLV